MATELYRCCPHCAAHPGARCPDMHRVPCAVMECARGNPSAQLVHEPTGSASEVSP